MAKSNDGVGQTKKMDLGLRVNLIKSAFQLHWTLVFRSCAFNVMFNNIPSYADIALLFAHRSMWR